MNQSPIQNPKSAILPPLIVLSGPSGAGKSTVVDEVLRASRFPLRRVITATTRQPRPGEQDRVDYHFWDVERFKRAIAAGEMLEYAVVYGTDHYGTPRSEVDSYRTAGVGVLLVIDVQGAEQVRQQYPADHLSVFLLVPSLGELEKRLRARGTESEERIARRLAAAERELARAGEFRKHVVNDTVPNAVRELGTIIDDEFIHRGITPCSTN